MNVIQEDCIVTFLDILGFKNKLSNNGLNKAVQDLKACCRHAALGKLAKEHGNPYKLDNDKEFSLVMSDSIVRMRTLNSYAPFFMELIDLVHAISDLSIQGFFIRGGISIGEVYYDPNSNLVVSKALSRSYKLESEIANIPRVIIDPVLLKLSGKDLRLKKEEHSFQEEKKYIDRLIRKDSDGHYFVDYLKAYFAELDNPNSDFPKVVNMHKEKIEIQLHTEDLRVQQKYGWLAEYHNTVISELTNKESNVLAGIYPKGLIKTQY